MSATVLVPQFEAVRQNIVGIDATIETPYGVKPLIYTDWTASGRLYHPIEDKLTNTFGALVGNTHSETTRTGTAMTHAYHIAQEAIKKHVNAGPDDLLMPVGSGMTGAVNKLQRILGLRIHERFEHQISISEKERPVVFVTHMEHHSNQTSWLETICDVVVLTPNAEGLVDLDNLSQELAKYADRPLKIGAFTSCSNVTGVFTPYHAMARIMHEHGGVCFVDFAASAPYIDIDMNPADPREKLDAIYFSPHKFLGGPGSTGVLIMNKSLYQIKRPDSVGGGIVDWTNPWGEHKFTENIESREDAGTPAFLQTIKTALSIKLKEQMGVENIRAREHAIMCRVFERLSNLPGLHILADGHQDRLAILSFYIDGLHYNYIVKLLNDVWGVQARGGCSCAGTYGHYLLEVEREHSKRITDKIGFGDNSEKPGWVRISFHPTTTDEELETALDAIEAVANEHRRWEKDYTYVVKSNEFYHHREQEVFSKNHVKDWFEL